MAKLLTLCGRSMVVLCTAWPCGVFWYFGMKGVWLGMIALVSIALGLLAVSICAIKR